MPLGDRLLKSNGNHRRVTTSEKNLVELTGIEPVTPWLQTRCSPS
jgi:hypothetical protein